MSNEIGGLILISSVFVIVLGINMIVRGLIEAYKFLSDSVMLYVFAMCMVGVVLFELGIYVIILSLRGGSHE